ncbi:MAG TPA: hypothetical protein VFQ01_08290, partial [Nocardioides sp.]|nr:hypothetical protein [Nocardioides sp.]
MSDPGVSEPDRGAGSFIGRSAPRGPDATDAFDTMMDSTDPALIVVTTTAENEPAGCLVGFHGQSSIAPHHYCVWLSKANHTYRVSVRAVSFAIHFLTEE